jgi:hypothetical protein
MASWPSVSALIVRKAYLVQTAGQAGAEIEVDVVITVAADTAADVDVAAIAADVVAEVDVAVAGEIAVTGNSVTRQGHEEKSSCPFCLTMVVC